jgi:hypothetical protein
MNIIRGPEQICVPEALVGEYTLRSPQAMVLAGEIQEAPAIMDVYRQLSELTFYKTDSHFHTAGTEMLVRTLPYAVGVKRINAEHPLKLVTGYGLEEGQSTEAMFVGPRHRKISPESAIWLGRALASDHIERTYYYDRFGNGAGIRHIEGLTNSKSGLRIVTDPTDVFGLIPVYGGSEIRYTDGLKLATGAEDIE